jgi:hypothetical protein
VNGVVVLPRIRERHPDISEAVVLDAWRNCIRVVPRLDKDANEYIAVGADGNGRLIEMIAIRSIEGNWLIYHAMTPPTKKVLAELGLTGR